MTVAYAITTALAILLLVGYIAIVKNKSKYLLVMYICVAVISLGYLLLSVAWTVEFAIFANDLAYFGSVFLPPLLLFVIVEICGLNYKKIAVIVLFSISVAVYALVLTSGWLPLYYQSVSLEFIDGSTVFNKVYGPLHIVYLIYLLAYFAIMFTAIIQSLAKKDSQFHKLSVFVLFVVLANIAVWFIEQKIDMDFEFLSVSYIMSELLLLCLYWIMQDYKLVSKYPRLNQPEEIIPQDSELTVEYEVELIRKSLPPPKN